jgi:hypothetical protein
MGVGPKKDIPVLKSPLVLISGRKNLKKSVFLAQGLEREYKPY